MPNPKVDWSQAPEWAVAWCVHEFRGETSGVWLGFGWDEFRAAYVDWDEEAPRFGYRGSVRNSLTVRGGK